MPTVTSAKPTARKPGSTKGIPKQGALVKAMAKRGYVTPLEASKLSRVPVGTIYAWIAKGVIQVERVGLTRTFVRVVDIKRILGPAFGG